MSNNLELSQLTANTADKDDFINDLLALIDSSITGNATVDATNNVAVNASFVVNCAAIVATNAPIGGTNITLPAMQRIFVVKNDAAAKGPVTFIVGSTKLLIGVGVTTIVHMDGTANGLDVIGSASAMSLAQLSDVDMSTPPTDGQVLAYSKTSGKWHPVTLASGGSGSGSSASSSPSVVQSAATARSTSITLKNAPKSGNVLIAIVNFYTNPVPVPSGWTAIQSAQASGSGNDGVVALYKVADGTETSIAITSDARASMTLFELANVSVNGIVMAYTISRPDAVTLNVPAGAIVVGMAGTSNDGGFTPGSAIPTAPSGTTTDAGANVSGRLLTGFHTLSASGSTTFQATFPTSNSDDYTTILALNAAS